MKIIMAVLLVFAAVLVFTGCDRLPDAVTNLLPGSGSDEGTEVAVTLPIDVHDDDAEPTPYDYYDGGVNGAGGEILPIIEIYDDRILFGGNEISIAELEDILTEYHDYDFTWEIRDAHQAAQVVYSSVVELFNTRGLRFIES